MVEAKRKRGRPHKNLRGRKIGDWLFYRYLGGSRWDCACSRCGSRAEISVARGLKVLAKCHNCYESPLIDHRKRRIVKASIGAGATFAMVARMLDISRQRVHQIYEETMR